MAIKVAVNRALTAITALPTAAALTPGNLTLLTTATASSSATLSFTSNINSTYDSYLFKFIDIHPATNAANFQFQGSTNTGSSYGLTVTTNFFASYHSEDGTSAAALEYQAGLDIAQGTGFIDLGGDTGNGNDECLVGTLHLFSPSSTTFVKHFMARCNVYNHNPYSVDAHTSGYLNTTSAVDAIQFKFDSGNIDAGTIKMYGVGPKQS
jgi:hypothetical protein